MLDLAGAALTGEERERLLHPLTGGVILFTRNFSSIAQLKALVEEIHSLREPRLLVATDQEGGRVQRFREDFTQLPPARQLGRIYDRDRGRALHLAEISGWLMAAELRAVGIDFSFAPVLDLDHGVSGVIGDRAFHGDPQAVAELAYHYMLGMRDAGMAAVGKHFPGHGGVEADSHTALPVDDRPKNAIFDRDLCPFEYLIRRGLEGVMPAHVVYREADLNPAGFSAYWLRDVLRGQLQFDGVIFSDDLHMAAAETAGGYGRRAEVALMAGCDVALICNCAEGAAELLDYLHRDYLQGAYSKRHENTALQVRLSRLRGRDAADNGGRGAERRRLAVDAVAGYVSEAKKES